MASKIKNLSNKGILLKKNAFVVIVKTEWNSEIVNELENGVVKICKANKVKTETIEVPGAVELAFAVKQHYSYSPKAPDAYIVLGAVIKGGTPHFEYVCNIVSQGVMMLNLQMEVPTIFGVLTLNTIQEANERTGGIHGHKGEEAALTALKMIMLNENLKPDQN